MPASPIGNFPSVFHIKTLHTSLLSPIRATCTTHLILLDFFIRTLLCEEYRSLSSSLCSFLHYLLLSFHLDPNILLNTLSNNFSRRSCRNVSDHVSHPYEETSKIIVLYVSKFKIFDSKPEDKTFCTEGWQALVISEFNMHLMFS